MAVALLAACENDTSPPAPVPPPTPTSLAETSPEREALTALYHATDGPNWTDSAGWLTEAPVGDWHGVVVDGQGRVTGLDLRNNGLSGEIPPQLGSLANLTDLRLNRNQLSGEIPPQLGNLANLERLSLGVNQLSGEIPPQLGDLTRLGRLSLQDNQLSGEIPPQLGDLTRLGRLSLQGNQLSGEIPAELGNLANLQRLALGTNQLSGEIPPQLGNLTGLQSLALRVNQLSGEIPTQLGNLTSLQSLSLGVNQLSGKIPPQLGNLANLQWLSIEENGLSGQIPPELGRLAHLQSLLLYRNQLSGELPPDLGGLANLRSLRLGSNNLSGQIRPWLGNLANLTDLRLHDNGLSGQIPAELGNLANLERLWLSSNQLSGEIPPELGKLASLEELWLGGNQLSGEIPAELGSLASLTALELSHNQLSGEIPPALGNLANLERLWLQDNLLSGEIPPALGNLPSLQVLWVHGNALSGDSAAGSPAPVRVAPAATAPPPSSGAPLAVALEEVFGGREFEQPIEIGVYPVGPAGGTGPGAFVAEREGRILLLHPDGDEAAELLDITDRVSMAGNEEGLLSVALDLRFEETGHLWLYYSARGAPRVTRLSRFAVDPADPRRVDPRSELVVLEVNQPYSNHNGGSIRFGPGGMLYLGLGDGGLAREAQNLGTLLGSVIRIDVREASAASPYAVPSDNPFVDAGDARPEIWAFGFRNPWRMAFDPATGVLWAGDVGRADIEEIDRVEAGGNYGWNRFEGTRCVSPRVGCDQEGTVLPAVEYGHHLGCSVTGGVVYRGKAIPTLAGHYLFSDFCRGQLWALPPDGGEVVEIAVSPRSVASFGADADGEVFVLTFWGAVLRIVPLER